MKNYITFFKEILIYGIGSILVKLFGFLTLPIYSRIFKPFDFGIIETIMAFVSVILILSGLGLDTASQRSFYDYKDDEEDKRKIVISTGFWALTFWSFFLSSIGFLFRERISYIFFNDYSSSSLIGLAIITIPSNILFLYFQGILRLRHKPGLYSLITFIHSALITLLSLALVAFFEFGLPGYFLGNLFGGYFSLTILIIILSKNISLKFDKKELITMLKFGLPLIPSSISSWLLSLANRFLLLHYTNPTEVGYYGAGNRISSSLNFVVGAVSAAWAPFILEAYNKSKEKEPFIRAQMGKYFSILLILCALFISLFSKELILLLSTSDYLKAANVIPLICISIVITGMNSIVATGISLERKTHYFAIYIFYSAVANIVFNSIFIPLFGIVGAALSLVLSYTLLLVLYYHRTSIISPSPYEIKNILLLSGISILLYFLGNTIDLDSWKLILFKLSLFSVSIIFTIKFIGINFELIKNTFYEYILNKKG